MSRTYCLIALILACTPGAAHARNSRVGFLPVHRLGFALGTVSTLSAVPSTITFYATNPLSGTVAGTSPATVSWQVLSGSHLQNWTLSLQAASSTFTSCPQI